MSGDVLLYVCLTAVVCGVHSGVLLYVCLIAAVHSGVAVMVAVCMCVSLLLSVGLECVPLFG